jgi:hypothetical protein
MKVGQLTKQVAYSLFGILVLTGASPSLVLAQGHDHAGASQQERQTPEQKKQLSDLVKIVRDATERFRNVQVAQGEGFALQFGCVSGGDFGAMGMHFVNGSRIGDDILDPTQPEILLYEPTSDGRVRLTGADFLVLKDVWDAKHTSPPQLMGQLFHLFDAPNRFGLPPFYTLHVWAWKDNPVGTFTNWNPKVSCDGFNGGQQ